MTHQRNHATLAIANFSRRGLIKGIAATGGLVIAAQLPGTRAVLAYETGADKMPHGVVTDPQVFVSIDKGGIVSIVAHRAEMGTGAARTTLPMIVADELDAEWTKVRIVQSPGDEEKYGNQDTDGSRSVRHFIQPMRQIGATVRLMLETAAAKRWGVNVDEVEARLHEVVHKPSGRKLGYGDLAADAAVLPVPPPDKLQLKDASTFRYMGKGNVPVVDLFDITTGRATYGQDVMLPGMKFAVVARPPVVQGKVATYDATETMKVPGVEKVVVIDGTAPPAKYAPLGGVAVIAADTWAALKGRTALKVTWDDGPNGSFDSVAYKTLLEENVRKPGKLERNEGEVDKALASAARVITAEYYAPHLAHATMEPPAATARRADGKWEIWAPVQSPGGARDDVAKALGAKPEDVTLHTTLLGGGFGRKSKCDFAIEAALLSRAMEGAPGESGLDTRGRYPPRLLPHRHGGTPRSRSRQGQQSRGLAPPQRRAEPVCELHAGSEISAIYRARHGLRRHAVQRAQRPAGKWRGAVARAGRLVPFRQQRGARVVDPVLRRRVGP